MARANIQYTVLAEHGIAGKDLNYEFTASDVREVLLYTLEELRRDVEQVDEENLSFFPTKIEIFLHIVPPKEQLQ